MASLARTGSARGNGNARSPSPSPSRVISFWASPKSELIPLLSRINSAVNPLLIRCYGGRVSPVRAEFIAGSRGGERGFAAISLPRGFCSRRGGRRSAMPSQFENPMMISLFENNKVCHDYFSHSERLRMLIRGEWRVANGEWGRRMEPPENPRAPATPSADRPRCPIAPCRASKGLKMLKTTRASYWLELASIWDRRHVRLGSAPPRLGAATLAMTGSSRGNGNSRSPSPSPSRVISFWASPKAGREASRKIALARANSPL